jgi:HAD superfamily (subfamily IA) hydrolase, TIGR02254
MNYSNLLFDADDTLFDFPKAAELAFHALCRANDLPDTPEARRLYETINRSLWDAFDRGEISKETLTTLRFVRFLEALGLERNPEKCDQDYLAALGAGVYPTPHAQEVCEVLSQTHRLYLVTNAVASVQRSRLQGSVFAPLFSDAFISEEAGAAKPQKAYFDYVLSHIPGADERNCLVIGDSPATDLLGANNAGLPCCWYNPNGLPRPAELRIDWEIADLRELYEIV